MDTPSCRRCRFRKVIKLQKMQDGDHDVYRCVECGYIFSPPVDPGEAPALRTPAADKDQAPRKLPEASRRQ